MTRRRPSLGLTCAALWNQHLSRAHLRRVQAAALRRLLRHAYAHVPYYRRLFGQHGVDPRSIRDPENLLLLPIGSKDGQSAELGEAGEPIVSD